MPSAPWRAFLRLLRCFSCLANMKDGRALTLQYLTPCQHKNEETVLSMGENMETKARSLTHASTGGALRILLRPGV